MTRVQLGHVGVDALLLLVQVVEVQGLGQGDPVVGRVEGHVGLGELVLEGVFQTALVPGHLLPQVQGRLHLHVMTEGVQEVRFGEGGVVVQEEVVGTGGVHRSAFGVQSVQGVVFVHYFYLLRLGGVVSILVVETAATPEVVLGLLPPLLLLLLFLSLSLFLLLSHFLSWTATAVFFGRTGFAFLLFGFVIRTRYILRSKSDIDVLRSARPP